MRENANRFASGDRRQEQLPVLPVTAWWHSDAPTRADTKRADTNTEFVRVDALTKADINRHNDRLIDSRCLSYTLRRFSQLWTGRSTGRSSGSFALLLAVKAMGHRIYTVTYRTNFNIIRKGIYCPTICFLKLNSHSYREFPKNDARSTSVEMKNWNNPIETTPLTSVDRCLPCPLITHSGELCSQPAFDRRFVKQKKMD